MKIVFLFLIGIHAFSSNDFVLRGNAFTKKLDAFYQRSMNPYSIFQTPKPAEYEELYSDFANFLKATFEVVGKGGFTGCASCKNSLSTIKGAARFPFLRPVIFEAAYEVCRIRGIPREVCRGALHLYAPWFLKVLQEVDLNSKEQKYLPQLLCFSLDNTCEYPEDIIPVTLAFPSSKQVPLLKKERPTSKHLRILQISDLHIDHNYTPGSEADCGLPICCRTTKSSKIKRPASVWGDYNCDLAPSMMNSMLEYIKTLPPLDLVIFTGDIPAHDVWNQTVATSTIVEASTFKLLNSVFTPMNIPVIPAIGNHETVPANNFSVSTDLPLYSSLADMWSDWIPLEAQKMLKERGVYSTHVFPGLKVISLNTNMCYIMNFWLVSSLPSDGQDPNSILHWLINELQASEDKGENVYIIGHVPPSHPDCFPYWSDQFQQIFNRYYKIISGQFYGHTHFDEFQISYRSHTEKTKDTAIGVSYIAPSVTTFEHVNPSFRIYDVEPEKFLIYDSLTYYTDLEKVLNSTDEPVWGLEYSARKFYGIPLEDSQPLSAAWWHDVVSEIENDNSTLQAYYQFMYKKSRPNETCDDACRSTILCDLRASNSSEACSVTTPVTRH